jgi:sec-independent protein translocase protein TatB
MSFSETIFLFFLALIIFGPKKLPEIARQAGKLLAELRRASNEFKSQIETEIAHLEVHERETKRAEAEKSLTAITSSTAPQGTVASLSLSAANSESAPSNASATLAAPTIEVASSTSAAQADPCPSSEPASETVAAVTDSPSHPESQASHV